MTPSATWNDRLGLPPSVAYVTGTSAGQNDIGPGPVVVLGVRTRFFLQNNDILNLYNGLTPVGNKIQVRPKAPDWQESVDWGPSGILFPVGCSIKYEGFAFDGLCRIWVYYRQAGS